MSDLIDPISGQTANVFLQQEEIISSVRKKENQLRNLIKLRTINNPTEPVDQLYLRSQRDIELGLGEQRRKEELISYGAARQAEALEVAQQASIRDPESIKRSSDILNNISAITERYATLDGQQQVEEDAYTPELQSELLQRQLATERYFMSLYQERADQDGMLDMVVDGVSLLAPDYIKDVNDLIGEGPFDSLEQFDEAIKEFQSRDPDEQNMLAPVIMDQLFDAFDGNSFKVLAVLQTMFDKTRSGSDIAFNAAFDLTAIPDAFAVIKTARLLTANRNLAKAAVDHGGLDDAARMQAVAGVDDAAVETATGTKKVDAAHSANPVPTSMIDEGTSFDDLAGEISKVKESQIRIINEDLLPISANRLPASTFKALRKERTALARSLMQAPDQAASARIKEINQQLDAGQNAVQAEKELAQLKAGDIPPQYKEQFDSAVQKEKEAFKARREEAAKPTPVKQTLTEEDLVMQAANSIGKVQEIGEKASKLVEDLIIPEAFSAKEQTAAVAKAKEKLLKDLDEAGQQINSLDIVEKTSKGFKMKYATTSGEGERVVNFSRNDFNQVVTEAEARTFQPRWQNMFGKLFSPSVLFETTFKDVVKDSTFLGQQAAKLRNGLADLWQESEAGLSKQEKFEVDSILTAGDEKAKVFSIAELREGGVETLNGFIKMTDRQIESYYQKRKIFDVLHDLRGGAIARKLEIEGYENLSHVVTVKGQDEAHNLIGRKMQNFDLSDVSGQIYFPEFKDPKQAFNTTDYVRTNKQQFNANDYDVVELLQPIRVGDKEVKTALVRKNSEWSSLPSNVLNYQAGYVPRIYPRGYYYVRDMDSPNREVLYAFETKEKATDWSRNASGNTAVYADREFNDVEKLVEESNAYGGLYTGSRKSRPLMVKDGDKEYRPERMSVGQATDRYISNISNILPFNEYRIATIERWKATVNALAEAQGRRGLGKEQRFDGTLDLEKDSQEMMEQVRGYINDVMGSPHLEERFTERVMLGMASMIQGKPFSTAPRKWLLDHSQGSVTDWIKGTSFNLHMGWFNARQLFIQSQNAALAVSMYPVHGIAAAGDALRLRTISMLPENKGLEAAKHLGLGKDIEQSLMQYNKSGMKDSIIRTADIEVNNVALSHGSLDAARKLSKAGRIFFNEGENFSRLMSWSIARRRWKEDNPGKSIGDKEIKEISQDAIRMQMNMQRENAAWWQTAPGLNVATQFLQVQAKFLESVMPKVLGGTGSWTAKEKRRAAIGQLMLYGVVGVPIAEEAVVYVSEMLGTTPADFMKENPGWTEQINEGFTGTLTSLLGAKDLAPSESFSLWAGIDDNIVWDLSEASIEIFSGGYGEAGAVETLAGPSANIIRRIGDVGSGLMLTAKTLWEVPSDDVLYGAVMSNMNDIASLTSTWSNARKLWLLNNTDKLFSSRGKLIATREQLGDMSLQTQLGIAMGFPTDIELNYYKTKDAIKASKKFNKAIKDDLKKVFRDYSLNGNLESFNAKKGLILKGLTDYEQKNILLDFNRDIKSPKSGVEREINSFIKEMYKSGGRVQPGVATIDLLQGESE